MPRKKFIPDSSNPYHVSVRSHNKEWFDLPIEDMWRIFSDYLFLTKHIFDLEILSFVLMNNHFHLLVRTPNANLDKAMNYFLRETSRVIGFEANIINQKFGGPYHWSLIKTYRYLLHAYKYVYRNPVEASIVRRVEEYPYSTLSCLLGSAPLIVPISCDDELINNTENHLAWLNLPYENPEDRNAIRNALTKSIFEFGKDKDKEIHRYKYILSSPKSHIFPD